ncbi:sugar-binding protein, partial [Bacteroidota bacterium]
MKRRLLLPLILLIASTSVFSQLEGTKWVLAPQAAALAVGPDQGDGGAWWKNSAEDVVNRACFFDDTISFDADGTFRNIMNGSTWIEGWQSSDPEGCNAPVAPHDGSNAATWAYDAVNKTLTVTGVGAHIGLPKVYNGGELSEPAGADAIPSITYTVTSMTNAAMTLDIAISGGWWRFEYVNPDYHALENSYYADPDDAADFSVTAKTMWDADSIYVHIDVSDDSLNTAHTNNWERDKVELYFDMDNSKIDAASGYDANDVSYGFEYGGDYSGILSGAVNAKDMKTETGWMIDIAIPWESLLAGFTPTEGMVIGYDVQAIDNDGGDREHKLAMMALADQGWTNPAYIGELKFLAGGKTMPIYPAFLPWSGYTGVPMNVSYFDDPDNAADFSATSKTLWDMDSIYVL